MSPKNIKPVEPVKPAVNEQILADLRAQMLAAGVTDEQVLADARRLALETGVQTAITGPTDLPRLKAAMKAHPSADRVMAFDK